MPRGSHQKSHPISGEDAISLQTCERMQQKLNSGAVKFAQFLPLQPAHIYGMRLAVALSMHKSQSVATRAHIWNETMDFLITMQQVESCNSRTYME